MTGRNSPGARRMRRLRSWLGMTQLELASKLHVSWVTVSRWENGRSRPTQSLRYQLKCLLDGRTK